MVAFRDGRCDNDDAISDSITCSCILIYVLAMRVRLGVLFCRGVDVVRVGGVTFVTTRDDMLR